MKTILSTTVLISILFFSCIKNNDDKIEIGKGFEIYLTAKPYSHNLKKDYSSVNFDTIVLSNTPILQYKDLQRYDTVNHKLTLSFSHDSLKISDAGVYGRMFVVTIDKKPIYCGFKWPVISSIPCGWVFIEEPYEILDNLNENEIVISFVSKKYADPRLDKRIVERLKSDGKLNNTIPAKISGNQ